MVLEQHASRPTWYLTWTARYLTDIELETDQHDTWPCRMKVHLIDTECSLSRKFALSYADDAAQPRVNILIFCISECFKSHNFLVHCTCNKPLELSSFVTWLCRVQHLDLENNLFTSKNSNNKSQLVELTIAS